jgi:aminopeptidase N
MIPLLLLSLLQSPTADARTDYDVTAYRLDLRVEPEAQRLSGSVLIEADVTAQELTLLELDLADELMVDAVHAIDANAGSPPDVAQLPALDHDHGNSRLRIRVPAKKQGERIAALVRYHGSPQAQNDFDGFHWARTADGRPWINTSCQTAGARSWWPCKDSYFHPEDKPERIEVCLRVPEGLYGVSNGRLVSRTRADGEVAFQWRHDYPIETYSVTLNVAPYEVVASELELPGLAEKLPFIYYVLPENAAKAKLQFAEVPALLALYSEAFGPFPFPKSKFALVETNFWGMEHSTAVAYGSSYPAWCKREGQPDPRADRNGWFDYILVHESAHEWWGNAVSVADWGDFWIHEGLATYAEAVYIERTRDRAAADRYLQSVMFLVPDKGSLQRGAGIDSGQAYDPIVYYKGAWVLHTLRQVLDDDDAWWRTLRTFNLEFRYENATTRDFRAVLERESGRSFEQFFAEWFDGRGYPRLSGEVRAEGTRLRVVVANEGSDGTGFHVPLDVAWTELGKRVQRRVELSPGDNDVTLECGAPPADIALPGLHRVLGSHQVTVR